MKTIVFTDAALRQLFALPDNAQDEIEGALERFAIEGRGDIKALSGAQLYRLRVGRYRVIFDQDRMTILALYVGKRETTTYRKGRI